jgi:SM-20-related protein
MSPVVLNLTDSPTSPNGLGTASFEFNFPSDLAALRRKYAQRGRVLIPSALHDRDAHRVLHALSQECEWGMRLGAGPGIGWQYAAPQDYQRMTPRQRQTLLDTARKFSATRGSHHYQVRAIAHDEFERAQDPSPLARFVDALNTPPVLQWLRTLTGAHDITRIAAQATRFVPGDFFATHSDAAEADHQRATCVFYFMRQWQRRWGGLLEFSDQQGGTGEAFVPRFNSMSVFRYNQEHAVTSVTPLRSQRP